MKNPCIVVVGYNRPDCLNRLLASLLRALYPSDGVTLMISLDKAEDDRGCKEIAESFLWPFGSKIVRSFPSRLGLREHILRCGDLTEDYDAVIILEDDLLVSPAFYMFVLEALANYRACPMVSGIALYSHSWNGYANRFFEAVPDGNDVFLGQFSITWGECWTKEWWSAFRSWYKEHQSLDPSNRLLPASVNRWPETSWGKYFISYLVEKNLFYVIPRFSMSTNFSALGEHAFGGDTSHQVSLLQAATCTFRLGPADKLMKYDVFFESMDVADQCFKNLLPDRVDVNLTGAHRAKRERFLLSTRRLKYRIVKSYGLELRPIEINVFLNVPGKEIFLYDTKTKGKKPASNEYSVYKYEMKGFSPREMFAYSFRLLWHKAMRFFAKRLKRR